MKYRVGRHLSSILELVKQMSDFYPEKAMAVSWPDFNDLMEHGVGYYYHDPDKAEQGKIFIN